MIFKLIKVISDFFKKPVKKVQTNQNMIAWSLESSSIRNFDIQKLYDEVVI